MIDLCEICGSENFTKLYDIEDEGNFTIIKCVVCSLVKQVHSFSPKDISRLYGHDFFKCDEKRFGLGYRNYYALERAFRKNFKRRARNVWSKFCTTPLELLDIGCGPGFFLDECQKIGISVMGVEPSTEEAEYAREKFGVEVANTVIEKFSFTRKFDAVSAWDVIEHCLDPFLFLDKAFSLLKPGGWLFLSTGDVSSLAAKLSGKRWHLFRLPEHLYFFDPQTINNLLKKKGFVVKNITYPTNYYTLNYALEKLSFGQLSDSWLDKFVVPINLFDIMEISAQRMRDSD